MVSHHRVHQHPGVFSPELLIESLNDPDLVCRSQETTVDGVKGHAQLRPMGRGPLHLAGQVQKGGFIAGRESGMGREAGGKQGAALAAHSG